MVRVIRSQKLENLSYLYILSVLSSFMIAAGDVPDAKLRIHKHRPVLERSSRFSYVKPAEKAIDVDTRLEGEIAPFDGFENNAVYPMFQTSKRISSGMSQSGSIPGKHQTQHSNLQSSSKSNKVTGDRKIVEGNPQLSNFTGAYDSHIAIDKSNDKKNSGLPSASEISELDPKVSTNSSVNLKKTNIDKITNQNNKLSETSMASHHARTDFDKKQNANLQINGGGIAGMKRIYQTSFHPFVSDHSEDDSSLYTDTSTNNDYGGYKFISNYGEYDYSNMNIEHDEPIIIIRETTSNGKIRVPAEEHEGVIYSGKYGARPQQPSKTRIIERPAVYMPKPRPRPNQQIFTIHSNDGESSSMEEVAFNIHNKRPNTYFENGTDLDSIYNIIVEGGKQITKTPTSVVDEGGNKEMISTKHQHPGKVSSKIINEVNNHTTAAAAATSKQPVVHNGGQANKIDLNSQTVVTNPPQRGNIPPSSNDIRNETVIKNFKGNDPGKVPTGLKNHDKGVHVKLPEIFGHREEGYKVNKDSINGDISKNTHGKISTQVISSVNLAPDNADHQIQTVKLPQNSNSKGKKTQIIIEKPNKIKHVEPQNKHVEPHYKYVEPHNKLVDPNTKYGKFPIRKELDMMEIIDFLLRSNGVTTTETVRMGDEICICETPANDVMRSIRYK